MQLVPLATDGRITVVATAPLPPGPVRVALRLHAGNVVVEALGPGGARRVGRLRAADTAAYRPVLARLAAAGQIGTCPARTVAAGALILHLGAPATCAPHTFAPHTRTPPATARTTRLRAAVPTVCAVRPSTVPRLRVIPAAARPSDDDRRPIEPVAARRSPLPARPPVRIGQPDDLAPRLTREQRRRVLWATLVVAAALLLACVLQPGVPAAPVRPCAGDISSCP